MCTHFNIFLFNRHALFGGAIFLKRKMLKLQKLGGCFTKKRKYTQAKRNTEKKRKKKENECWIYATLKRFVITFTKNCGLNETKKKIKERKR